MSRRLTVFLLAALALFVTSACDWGSASGSETSTDHSGAEAATSTQEASQTEEPASPAERHLEEAHGGDPGHHADDGSGHHHETGDRH